jgi:KDO2-lipid IV(A) lauroyltransferase
MGRNAFQNWVEYAVLQTVRAGLLSSPVDHNLRHARLLALAWARIQPQAMDRAVENLTHAFQSLSEHQIRELAAASMRNFAMTGVELLQSPRLISPTTWARYVQLRGFKPVLRLAMEGKPAILISGHFGNFELLGQIVACIFGQFSVVMRPMNNPLVDRFLVDTRSHCGLELIMKKGAVGPARRVLRERGLLGVIPDQNAGSTGIFVDFFGRPASTFKTVALLACEFEVPIAVGYCRRLGEQFRHEVGVVRVIEPGEWRDQADPVRWITQEYTTAIEGMVRRHPEQYLWTHRRWKTQPRGVDHGTSRD